MTAAVAMIVGAALAAVRRIRARRTGVRFQLPPMVDELRPTGEAARSMLNDGRYVGHRVHVAGYHEAKNADGWAPLNLNHPAAPWPTVTRWPALGHGEHVHVDRSDAEAARLSEVGIRTGAETAELIDDARRRRAGQAAGGARRTRPALAHNQCPECLALADTDTVPAYGRWWYECQTPDCGGYWADRAVFPSRDAYAAAVDPDQGPAA